MVRCVFGLALALACVCLSGTLVVVCAASSSSLPPYSVVESFVQVTVDGGVLQGYATEIGTEFRSVPYAQPPVGPLRWQPPQPFGKWDGVFNATEWGAGCPQHCKLPPGECPTSYSEDCLTMNLYVPVKGDKFGQLPIMVFFPGGHFQQGGANVDLYLGNLLANFSNVIVVTCNYRLGALGWLVNTPAGIEGNYGLLDQQMALQWLQTNAAVFGGDATQITLFGQSAGGNSINGHQVSPKSTGLYRSVIVESSCFGVEALDTETGNEYGANFAKIVGCEDNDAACFEALSIDQVLAGEYGVQGHLYLTHPLQLFLPWTLYVDGDIVPVNPLSAYIAGSQFTPVPMIAGNVNDEALMFIYQADANVLSTTEYLEIVAYIFPLHFLEIVKMFPANETDSRYSLTELGNSYIFWCPTRAMIRGNAAQEPSTYMYHFNHVMSFGSQVWGPNYTECDNHVCHGEELGFVFSAVRSNDLEHFTADERVLSNQMMGYWGNFAWSGSPNSGPTSPGLTWPQWDESTMQNIEFMVKKGKEGSGGGLSTVYVSRKR